MIDTGIWPEHPSFANHGLPAAARAARTAASSATAATSRTSGRRSPATASWSAPTPSWPPTWRTSAPTGTSSATTRRRSARRATPRVTARTPPRPPPATGSTPRRCTASSAARSAASLPGARVIMYRVCLAQGCFGSDSVAAVQQAILDDVDVINFSISGGEQPVHRRGRARIPRRVPRRDLRQRLGRQQRSRRRHDRPRRSVGDDGRRVDLEPLLHVDAAPHRRRRRDVRHAGRHDHATASQPATPVVLAAEPSPGEDVLCQTKLTTPAQIARRPARSSMCQRGTNARVDKGFNVSAGGAAGMILYNPINAGRRDRQPLAAGDPRRRAERPRCSPSSTGTPNVKATWAQGTSTRDAGRRDGVVLVARPAGDFIKPDVTAPGIQVLAGMTPQPDETTPTNGPPGNLYQAIAGTSMSSPHAAGVSALVKAAHPDWTPAEIKSALMTSSVQDVVKEDGVTPADSVRRRRRLDPRRPRRSTRRSSSTRPSRTSSRRRPTRCTGSTSTSRASTRRR